MMHTPCCKFLGRRNHFPIHCMADSFNIVQVMCATRPIYIQKEQSQNTTTKYDKLALENNVKCSFSENGRVFFLGGGGG